MTNGALLFGEMVARKPGSQSLGMIACALLIVAVFTVDLLTPHDVAVSFLYALVVGTCLWWATLRQTVAIVGTISVMIVIACFLSPEGRFWGGLVNDGIALMTLGLLAYSGLSYRNAVDKVQQRERELTDFVENAAVGMNWVGPDGSILWANTEQLNIIGCNREEYVGRNIAEFHVDKPVIEDMLAKVNANVALKDCEARLRHKDGSLRHVVISANAYFEDGRFIHTRCFTRDITDRLRAEQAMSETNALAAVNAQLRAETIERKAAEQTLVESEERYRYLFESNPMPMWIRRDDTLHIVTVNDAAVQSYGYTRDEFDRMTSFNLQPADRLAAYEKFVRERPAGMSTHHHLSSHRKKDGSIIDVEVTSHPISYAGSPARLVLVQDITERKRAEEAQAWLAAIVEHATVAIFTRTLDGTILSWNAGAERMLGYTAKEAIGLPIAFTLPPGRPPNLTRNNENLLRGEVVARESDRITKDGRVIDVLTSHSPIKDGAGNIVGASVILQDISALKQAQAAVKESEQRFRAIFDYAGVGITMRPTHDRHQPWVQVNDRFCKLLGYTREELLGLSTADITPADEQAPAVKDNERLLRGEISSYVREKRVVRKDGSEIWVILAVAALPDARGRPVNLIAVYQDITERKQAERELERQAALSRLLESLAAAANKADAPEEALGACLERICAYGGWNIGNVLQIARHGDGWRASGTQWHFADSRAREHFSDFITLFNETLSGNSGGIFINHLIRTRAPQWIRDLAQVKTGFRLTCAKEAGLRAAFAFPVIVHDEVVACVEFFTAEVREPDTALIEAAGDIASHLARVIERERSRKIHAQLAAIVETSPDAIVSRALDGTILSWNQGAERMFGYSAAEVVGKDVLIIPEDCIAETQRNREFVNAGNTLSQFETVRITRDGRRIQVAVSAAPIRDASGKVSSVAAIVRDITERKQAERELERKTALAQLLEALARTVNEAGSPEAAMQVCLARICEHGGWAIGRLGIYAEPAEGTVFPERSFWHTAEPSCYEEFMHASLDSRFYVPQGTFISVVLREKRAVWVSSISSLSGFGRMSVAVKQGLHCAFAFPVVVRDKVVAFLEFFAEETRPADPLLLENINSIAGQLARLVERDRATMDRERLANIVENSGAAIWSRAADDTLMSWNAAAERLFGWTRAEVIGKQDNFLVPAEHLHERQVIPERLASGEDAIVLETVRLRKDGTPIDVELRASVTRDASGKVKWTAFIVHDITARKGAEQALLESEERYRKIVETSLDCIISIDDKGTLIEFNPSAETTFGYTREAMIGRPAADLMIPPALIERHCRELAQHGATGNATLLNRRVELTAARADGSEFPVELSISSVNNRRGSTFTAFLRDITEKKRSNDAARVLAMRQSTTAELSVYAVTEIDVKKIMDRAALLVRDIFAVSHVEILRLLPDGKSLLLVSGTGWKDGLIGTATVPAGSESQAGYTLAQGRVMADGETRYDPVIVEDLGAETRFRVPLLLKEYGIRSGMSVPLYGARRPFGVLGVHCAQPRSFTADDAQFLQAISGVLAAAIQRAENYDEIRQSHEQLRALAGRMVRVREEERLAIAREVHDELGQALTAMKIDITLIKNSVDLARRLPRQRVREELASVMGMIDQSIQSVRRISTTLRPVLLDELGFIAAFEWQGRDFEKRHHIRCKVMVTEPITEPPSDAAIALFRIFQEALTNVVRHSEAREVVAEFHQEGNDLVLRVSDDGKGMPAFSGTSSRTLGLAGMRERAMLFGGNVQFESAADRGTTVIARIPTSPALQD